MAGAKKITIASLQLEISDIKKQLSTILAQYKAFEKQLASGFKMDVDTSAVQRKMKVSVQDAAALALGIDRVAQETERAADRSKKATRSVREDIRALKAELEGQGRGRQTPLSQLDNRALGIWEGQMSQYLRMRQSTQAAVDKIMTRYMGGTMTKAGQPNIGLLIGKVANKDGDPVDNIRQDMAARLRNIMGVARSSERYIGNLDEALGTMRDGETFEQLVTRLKAVYQENKAKAEQVRAWLKKNDELNKQVHAMLTKENPLRKRLGLDAITPADIVRNQALDPEAAANLIAQRRQAQTDVGDRRHFGTIDERMRTWAEGINERRTAIGVAAMTDEEVQSMVSVVDGRAKVSTSRMRRVERQLRALEKERKDFMAYVAKYAADTDKIDDALRRLNRHRAKAQLPAVGEDDIMKDDGMGGRLMSKTKIGRLYDQATDANSLATRLRRDQTQADSLAAALVRLNQQVDQYNRKNAVGINAGLIKPMTRFQANELADANGRLSTAKLAEAQVKVAQAKFDTESDAKAIRTLKQIEAAVRKANNKAKELTELSRRVGENRTYASGDFLETSRRTGAVSYRGDEARDERTRLDRVATGQKEVEQHKRRNAELRRASALHSGIGSRLVEQIGHLMKFVILYRTMYSVVMGVQRAIHSIFAAGFQWLKQTELQKLGLSGILAENYKIRDVSSEISDGQPRYLTGLTAVVKLQSEAAHQWRQLQSAALAVVGTTEDLMMLYNSILPFAAKLKQDTGSVQEMVKSTAIAASLMGISFADARSAIVSLLQGRNLQRNKLVAALGFTTSDLKELKGTPQLFDSVLSRLEAFRHLADMAEDSFGALLESFRDFQGILGAGLATPFVSLFKEFMRGTAAPGQKKGGLTGLMFESTKGELKPRPELDATLRMFSSNIGEGLKPLSDFLTGLDEMKMGQLQPIAVGVREIVRLVSELTVMLAKATKSVLSFGGANAELLKVMAGGAIILSITSHMSRFGASIVGTVKGWQQLGVELTAGNVALAKAQGKTADTAKTVGTLGAATTRLRGAMMSLFAGVGLGLVITGIGLIAAKYLEWQKQAERTARANRMLANSIPGTGARVLEDTHALRMSQDPSKVREGFDKATRAVGVDRVNLQRLPGMFGSDQRYASQMVSGINSFNQVPGRLVMIGERIKETTDTIGTLSSEQSKYLKTHYKGKRSAAQEADDPVFRQQEAAIALQTGRMVELQAAEKALKDITTGGRDTTVRVIQDAAEAMLESRQREAQYQEILDKQIRQINNEGGLGPKLDPKSLPVYKAIQREQEIQGIINTARGKTQIDDVSLAKIQALIERNERVVLEPLDGTTGDEDKSRYRAPDGRNLYDETEDAIQREFNLRVFYAQLFEQNRLKGSVETSERILELEEERLKALQTNLAAKWAMPGGILTQFKKSWDTAKTQPDRDNALSWLKEQASQYNDSMLEYQNDREKIRAQRVVGGLGKEKSIEELNQETVLQIDQFIASTLGDTEDKVAAKIDEMILNIKERYRNLGDEGASKDVVDKLANAKPILTMFKAAEQGYKAASERLQTLKGEAEDLDRKLQIGQITGTTYVRESYENRQAQIAALHQMRRDKVVEWMASTPGSDKRAEIGAEIKQIENAITKLEEITSSATERFEAFAGAISAVVDLMSQFGDAMTGIGNFISDFMSNISRFKSIGSGIENYMQKWDQLKTNDHNPGAQDFFGMFSPVQLGKGKEKLQAAIGGITAVFGVALTVMTSMFQKNVERAKNIMGKSLERLRERIEEESLGLGLALKEAERLRDSYQKEYSKSKSGRAALKEMKPQFDSEISQLQQQIKSIRKSFEDNLKVLQLGNGPYADFAKTLLDMEKQAREYLLTFSENTLEYATALDNVNKLFDLTLAGVRRSMQENMLGYEQEAISSMEQVFSLIEEQQGIYESLANMARQRVQLDEQEADMNEAYEEQKASFAEEEARLDEQAAEKLEREADARQRILDIQKQIADILKQQAEDEASILRRGVLEAQLTVAEQKAQEIANVRDETREALDDANEQLEDAQEALVDAEDGEAGGEGETIKKARTDLEKKIAKYERDFARQKRDLDYSREDLALQEKKLLKQQALNAIRLAGAQQVAAIENSQFGLVNDEYALAERRAQIEVELATLRVKSWEETKNLVESIYETINGGMAFDPPVGFPMIRVEIGNIVIDNTTTTNNSGGGGGTYPGPGTGDPGLPPGAPGGPGVPRLPGEIDPYTIAGRRGYDVPY